MNKKKTLENWEFQWLIIAIITIGVSALIELCAFYLTNKYPLLFSSIVGLASGIVATVFIFWLQRRHERKKLHDIFSNLAGNYIRIDIGQDNTPEEEQIFLQADNLNLPMQLSYLGGYEFKVKADYWKSDNAKVEAAIQFDIKDNSIARGKYRYIGGAERYLNHFGTYEIHYNENDKQLICFYKHLYPRRGQNIDNNRGWQVWQKVD